MAQQHGCAGIPRYRPQTPAHARLHPLRGQLTPMKTTPPDASDGLARNSLYAFACARLTGSYVNLCPMRQASQDKD